MVRGFARGVKLVRWRGQAKGIAKGTLLLYGLRPANIRQKTRMRSAKLREVGARLVQAELAVDRQAHVGGVPVILAVILPPANGAQLERAGRMECFISTAGAAIANIGRCQHI